MKRFLLDLDIGQKLSLVVVAVFAVVMSSFSLDVAMRRGDAARTRALQLQWESPDIIHYLFSVSGELSGANSAPTRVTVVNEGSFNGDVWVVRIDPLPGADRNPLGTLLTSKKPNVGEEVDVNYVCTPGFTCFYVLANQQ